MAGDDWKAVSLTFRGFECSPDHVEALLGVAATRKGVVGDPVKPGVKATLKRSVVRYAFKLDEDARLRDVIPYLLGKLGGVAAIAAVRNAVEPEFLELDILWPARSSEYEENGAFEAADMADLVALDCSLGLSFK